MPLSKREAQYIKSENELSRRLRSGKSYNYVRLKRLSDIRIKRNLQLEALRNIVRLRSAKLEMNEEQRGFPPTEQENQQNMDTEPQAPRERLQNRNTVVYEDENIEECTQEDQNIELEGATGPVRHSTPKDSPEKIASPELSPIHRTTQETQTQNKKVAFNPAIVTQRFSTRDWRPTYLEQTPYRNVLRPVEQEDRNPRRSYSPPDYTVPNRYYRPGGTTAPNNTLAGIDQEEQGAERDDEEGDDMNLYYRQRRSWEGHIPPHNTLSYEDQENLPPYSDSDSEEDQEWDNFQPRPVPPNSFADPDTSHATLLAAIDERIKANDRHIIGLRNKYKTTKKNTSQPEEPKRIGFKLRTKPIPGRPEGTLYSQMNQNNPRTPSVNLPKGVNNNPFSQNQPTLKRARTEQTSPFDYEGYQNTPGTYVRSTRNRGPSTDEIFTVTTNSQDISSQVTNKLDEIPCSIDKLSAHLRGLSFKLGHFSGTDETEDVTDFISDLNKYLKMTQTTDYNEKYCALKSHTSSIAKQWVKLQKNVTDWDTLMKAFKERFEIDVTTKHFNKMAIFKMEQRDDEDFATFCTRVQTRAKNMDIPEGELVTIIIEGCNNENLKEHLMMSKVSTINEMLKLPLTKRKGKKNSEFANVVELMNDMKTDFISYINQVLVPNTTQVQTPIANTMKRCYHCGQNCRKMTGTGECPARNQICNHCNIMGHFESVCNRRKVQENEQRAWRGQNQYRSIQGRKPQHNPVRNNQRGSPMWTNHGPVNPNTGGTTNRYGTPGPRESKFYERKLLSAIINGNNGKTFYQDPNYEDYYNPQWRDSQGRMFHYNPDHNYDREPTARRYSTRSQANGQWYQENGRNYGQNRQPSRQWSQWYQDIPQIYGRNHEHNQQPSKQWNQGNAEPAQHPQRETTAQQAQQTNTTA